jgi:hypothetical protein
MFSFPEIKNNCAYDSNSIQSTAGIGYMVVVFVFVMGILNEAMTLRREYPKNCSRNILMTAICVMAVIGFAKYPERCNCGNCGI